MDKLITIIAWILSPIFIVLGLLILIFFAIVVPLGSLADKSKTMKKFFYQLKKDIDFIFMNEEDWLDKYDNCSRRNGSQLFK